MSLNLARRPFVNTRPVTRLSVALWLAGGALSVWNGLEIWRQVHSLDERRAALVDVENRAAAARARIAGLEATLEGIDLQRENEETTFLNREIERRTLSWTRLFERLSEVLPRQVRVVRIAPALGSPAQRRGPQRSGAAPDWISLTLLGYAESDEALLDFVDALFSHPAFHAPDLQREAVAPGQPVQFDLVVEYLPENGAKPAVEPERTSAQGSEDPGSPDVVEHSTASSPAVAPGGERARAAGSRAHPGAEATVPRETPAGMSGRRTETFQDSANRARPVAGAVAEAQDEPADEGEGLVDRSSAGGDEKAASSRWVPRQERVESGSTIVTPVTSGYPPNVPPGYPNRAGAPPLALGAPASATRRLR